MSEKTPRDMALSDLVTHTTGLGADELRVLAYVANRLRMGAAHYGRLDLATDSRLWAREQLEEAADLLVYCAAADLSGQRRKPAKLSRSVLSVELVALVFGALLFGAAVAGLVTQ